ncbi:hypothetical protein CDD83_6418 [Cordyceps sp. RAO-2017]|nr:hypothetical protein CDD83_6418 [Cordyceps sp. RAO-2017]
MACAGGEQAAAFSGDDVWPYRIHMSSKYLELTRRKLELTRLPHKMPEPRSDEWWEPQPAVEPLLDFWLERFSWRDQERDFNAHVPQYRTAIKPAGSESPVRLHFVHARSPSAHAIPLLLIPPFPFTNLSLTHLIGLFTEPRDAAADQPFHLVMPSLPGLGFSDALPDKMPMIPSMAQMLDILMRRLGYRFFLVSNSGPSAHALAHVDWRVASHLALHHPDSCLGVHFLSPPLSPPQMRDSPLAWAKWKAASIVRSPMLGYSREDLDALRGAEESIRGRSRAPNAPTPLGLGTVGASEPNTLAYALCDSPLGLLLFFLMVLRISGLRGSLPPAEVIKMTELTWLPGPEGTMRLWAHSASRGLGKQENSRASRPRAAITVFLGDQELANGPRPRPAHRPYVCPAWASQQYRVLASSRVKGEPGLLVWERPEVIAAGARMLAKAVLAVDARLGAARAPSTVSLERPVVDDARNKVLSAETTRTATSDPEDARRRPPQAAEETIAKPLASEAITVPSTPDCARRKPIVTTRERRHAGTERDEDAEEQSGGGSEESGQGSPDTVIAVKVGP